MASLPIGWVVDLIQTGDKKSVKIAYTGNSIELLSFL